MNNSVKTCLLCCRKLVGRSDKKFCNDACRNEYNNRLNCDTTNLMRRINYVLRKNRRVLQNLCNHYKGTITRQQLEKEGFDFRYFTNTLESPSGATGYFCYELGIAPLDPNRFELIASQHN